MTACGIPSKLTATAELEQRLAKATATSFCRTSGRTVLQALEFSTRELPACEQFIAWRDSFAPLANIIKPDNAANGFNGHQIIWDLGALALCHIKTEEVSFSSLSVKHEPLDHWTITLTLRGSVNTVAPTRTYNCPSGIVQIGALGRSFTGSITDSELLMLFVPRDFGVDVARTLAAAEFTTLDTGMGKLFADYLVGLANRLPIIDIQDIPELVRVTRAMILACVAPSPDITEDAPGPVAAVLLEKSRQFVQARLYDPDLDAEALRRALGVSRTRLYRLFEPLGGVKRYIQRRRLLDAHAALSNPDDHRRILEIAEQRGYNDGSEFSRAFKREFGCSPSDVRKGEEYNVPNRPANQQKLGSPIDHLATVLRRLHG